MGLLGLRKFIDSSGCTRLLPVPVSDAEAEEEALRRLRVEGYSEVKDHSSNGTHGLYYESGRQSSTATGRHHSLTSSTHVNGAAEESGATTFTVVDHVLVDMNCIVHSCFHHQVADNKSKRQLIQEVLERLRVLVTEVVVPRQSLSICFDGPAPIAKLQTQRLRRRKVSLLDTGGMQQLSTLAITAGSLFMIELENAIAAQFKLNHGRGFLRRACPVYLYGTTVMGEGEAKISRALAYLAYGPPAEAAAAAAAAAAEASRQPGEEVVVAAQHGRNGQRGNSYHNDKSSVGADKSHGGNRLSQQNGQRGGAGGGGGNAAEQQSGHRRGRGAQEHADDIDAYEATTAATGAAGAGAAGRSTSAHYNPDDTVVVLGNDIDLVVTCVGATAYHNLSIISPSSLQLIRVSDILYRWLKATSAMSGSSPFTPSQLPSIRVDFIYLFLLNGGDHYVGAGEVAMSLWSRYRSVRAAYPNSSLVSPTLDSIDVDFLADVVQASEYTGSSDAAVGMNLLQSALWSLYTVVTGVCPDYGYVPEPESPLLANIRAAAAQCQRTHRRIRLPPASKNTQPLAPLETFIALMPTEAALPKSVAAGLHSKPAHQAILKTLETSNDTAMIARAARDAVAVSEPFLTTSEQYLRHFTSPVQLNVVPPRRRISRHEQHRMAARGIVVQQDEPVPVVQPIAMAEDVSYLDVPYSAKTRFLHFTCPFESETSHAEEGEVRAAGEDVPAAVVHVQGRAVLNRPSMHAAAPVEAAATKKGKKGGGGAAGATVVAGEDAKRVYLFPEEAARVAAERDRETAATKLKRKLGGATLVKQRNQHFTPAQERQMRRRLRRLMAAEEQERHVQLAKEEKKYAEEVGHDTAAIEEEVLRFLGEGATAADLSKIMMNPAKPKMTAAKKERLARKKKVAELPPPPKEKLPKIGPRILKKRLTRRKKAALEREEQKKTKLAQKAEKERERKAMLRERRAMAKRKAERQAEKAAAAPAKKRQREEKKEMVVARSAGRTARTTSSRSSSVRSVGSSAPAKKQKKEKR